MTQEQKAKAYDEAIERAKEINDEKRAQPFDIMTRVFPELKESEDEKIRKEIIDFIYDKTDTYELREKSNSWLSWLEKQGEGNQDDPREDALKGLLAADDTYQMSVNEEMVSEAKKKAVEALSKLEIGKLLDIGKECHVEPCITIEPKFVIEPKFKVRDIIVDKQGSLFQVVKVRTDDWCYECVSVADSVETICHLQLSFSHQDEWKLFIKFQEGDWIVDCRTGKSHQIEECNKINSHQYSYDLTDGGYIPSESVGNYRPWAIEDAKDGDFLVASDGSLFIFAGISESGCKFHAALAKDEKIVTGTNGVWETAKGVIGPANHKQRNILLKAIVNGGFSWNPLDKTFKKENAGLLQQEQ